MANKKITELTELTEVDNNDVIAIVDDPGGSPLTKKIKVSNLVGDVFQDYNGHEYKINNPYNNGGSLHLKGQIHCHTTNSDGVDTPTELVTAYEAAGYDFITITDHDYLTADPSVAGITWLGVGCEENYYGRHVIGYDLTEQSTDTNIQDIINFHRENNKVCSVCHPNSNGYLLYKTDLQQLHSFNLIEVKTPTSTCEDQWDWALSSNKKVFGVGVDDCHDVAGAYFDTGWIVVHTDTDSKATILQSIREGNFYASSGNDISISITGNIITASSTGSSNFSFIGKNGIVLKTENGVTSSEYTILGDETYVRVESTLVADSTKAWSQPVFIDKLVASDGENESKTSESLFQGSMARKLLINGNFDIWDYGTSSTAAAGGISTANRWRRYATADGGTLPTLTASRESIVGSIPGSFYAMRITSDGASSSLGATARDETYQHIERCTRLFCGSGKKITVSLWARSDISGKRLGIRMLQYYGSGGSPTSLETINGTNFTLDSIFRKYTHTFVMNTLHWPAKTFGTDDNDFCRLGIDTMWGSTFRAFFDSSTDEDWAAGYVDIAQIEVVAGDQDLPYVPRTYNEERLLCQRYYWANTVRTINGIMYYSLPTTMYKATMDIATASAGTIANVTKDGFQITHNANADSNIVLESEII